MILHTFCSGWGVVNAAWPSGRLRVEVPAECCASRKIRSTRRFLQCRQLKRGRTAHSMRFATLVAGSPALFVRKFAMADYFLG